MCGICGKLTRNSNVNERTIKKMMKIMNHRGPDDRGHLIEKNLGLGHVRLSIIDLSEKGHQPMPNDDNSLWIVYNGEIYNYIELRKELKREGFKFKSKSDTEVLLKAYECWGEKCLSKLNGMFSFVIYDKKKRLLFGARDRFGIKPFHYYQSANKFIFASEIKPILLNGIKPVPNYYAIHNFLLYRLMYNSDDTFFKGIKKLLPGHYIKINIDSLKVKIVKWWELEIKVQDITKEVAISKFSEIFKHSVNIRLRSDVPVGSCLSGGLDSSSIVCTMVDILGSPENVKTFSSIYELDFYGNEKKYIEDVVDASGVKSYEVEPSSKNLMEKLKNLIYYQEEPFLGLSPLAQWEVMNLAKKNNMKVLLDGQGGDETLAGYLGYLGFYYANLLKRGKFGSLRHNLKTYKELHGRKYPAGEIIYPLVPGYFKRRAKVKQAYFLDRNFHKRYEGPNKYLDIIKSSPLNERLKNSVNYQLLELLRFEDKSSMACSIETRLPFLDFRLVQYLFTLPAELKLKDGKTKYVFREAMMDVLPKTISERHDKVGFATPDEIWLGNDKVWREVKTLLTSDKATSRGIFTKKGIDELLKSYQSGKSEESKHIWSLVILELWFRMFIENRIDEISKRLGARE